MPIIQTNTTPDVTVINECSEPLIVTPQDPPTREVDNAVIDLAVWQGTDPFGEVTFAAKDVTVRGRPRPAKRPRLEASGPRESTTRPTQSWTERVNGFIASQDLSRRDALISQIEVVEKEGGRLALRERGGDGLSFVTWRDGQFVVAGFEELLLQRLEEMRE